MDVKGIDSLDFSRVLKTMRDEQMDALVAMEPHTVALLLNYWNEIYIPFIFRETPTCVVIPASGDIFAVLPRRNHKIAHAPWVKEFIGRYTDASYYDQGRVVEALVEALKDKGLAGGKIGFEMRFVPAGILSWLESELPAIEPVDAEWILWQLRAVKTEKQLGFIRQAVDACEAGVEEILRGWKAGESIHRLLDEFERVVRERGADFFGTYQRAVAKKWVPFSGRDQRLSEDFFIRADDEEEVLFDLIVRYQAYVSDWKRAIYLGTPPKEIADRYDLQWRAHRAIVKAVRPGMTTVEAQNACEDVLAREGIATWWCVHSVGLEIHEEPLISSSLTAVESGEAGRTRARQSLSPLSGGSRRITYEPNTVVMAETKHTEDPYLMTTEGLKRLNTLPQKLFVV
jgi:Xaa-Pro aminopeptidase